MERLESSKSLLERLKNKGVTPEDLQPLGYNEEIKLYSEVVRRERKRLDFTTQAQ
jgi:hypothetical protein